MFCELVEKYDGIFISNSVRKCSLSYVQPQCIYSIAGVFQGRSVRKLVEKM